MPIFYNNHCGETIVVDVGTGVVPVTVGDETLAVGPEVVADGVVEVAAGLVTVAVGVWQVGDEQPLIFPFELYLAIIISSLPAP